MIQARADLTELHSPGFWLAAVVAAMLVGLSKGGLQTIGLLGVPVLSLLISPVVAAGILLPVYVVSDVFGLWAYRRDYSGRHLAILIPATTIGVGLGWAAASSVSEQLVTGIVGAIGLIFALYQLLRRPVARLAQDAAVTPGLFWGTIAGFTSFVSNAGGPPFQVYVLPHNLHKAVYAGTTTILFAYVNVIKLFPYYALGQLSLANLQVSALLLLPGAIAVYIGVRLTKILPEVLFFRVVTWLLLLVSVKLLWDGLKG